MSDFNKITRIMEENNWNADVDRLFIAILEHLSNDKKKLRVEYSVKELCNLCKKINIMKDIVSARGLTYPKNVLFSNLSGRDYIIFSGDFDIDTFTKNVSKGLRRRVEEDYAREKVYINPKYIDAVYAGKNEKIFITEFEKKYGKGILEQKIFLGKREDVNISVDNSISYNKKKVLIEIDSGNVAKLLVGQYFLLNQLIKNEEKDDMDYIFLVIHYYKDYDPKRTEKNLNLVRNCIGNSAIKFKAFTQKSFIDFYNGNDIEGLINKLFYDK